MKYLLILFLLLWSCIPGYRLSRPELVYNTSEGARPALNTESVADSGSVIYSEFQHKINPAVMLDKKLTSEYRDVSANVRLSRMEKDGEQVYGTVSISDQSITYLRDVDDDGTFDQILVQARKNATNWADVTPVGYHKVKGIKSESGGFQLELSYAGRKEDTAFFNYREYRDDLTRTATSREIRHVLNNSDTLTVNGARIKIIGATQNELSYIVLQGFDR